MRLGFNKHNLHVLVMMLCFIYGGVSLMFFLIQIGPLIGSPRALPSQFEREFDILFNDSSNDSEEFLFRIRPERVERFQANISGSFYSVIFISLSGSIISILAGTSLWVLLRKKERKKLTDDIVNTMTTDEEKLVMRTLEENDNELTQNELVKRTKLSKVKIHRVIKRLESMGIVSKYSYGMTNKIRLNSGIHKKKHA
jgi:uncharacterized membrane protein